MGLNILAAFIFCNVITTTYGHSVTATLNRLNCMKVEEDVMGQQSKEEISIIETYKPIELVSNIIDNFGEAEISPDTVRFVGDQVIECRTALTCHILCGEQISNATGSGDKVYHLTNTLMLQGDESSQRKPPHACFVQGVVGTRATCNTMVQSAGIPVDANTAVDKKLMTLVASGSTAVFKELLTNPTDTEERYRCKASTQTLSYLAWQDLVEIEIRELLESLDVFPFAVDIDDNDEGTECEDVWGAGRLVLRELSRRHSSGPSGLTAASLCDKYRRFVAKVSSGRPPPTEISRQACRKGFPLREGNLESELQVGGEGRTANQAKAWKDAVEKFEERHLSTIQLSEIEKSDQGYIRADMIEDVISGIEDIKLMLHARMRSMSEDLCAEISQARQEVNEVLTVAGSRKDGPGECQVREGNLECSRPPYLLEAGEDGVSFNIIGRQVTMFYRRAVRFKCLPLGGPDLEIFAWNKDTFYSYVGSFYKYGDWSVNFPEKCMQRATGCPEMTVSMEDLPSHREPFLHERAYWFQHEDWLYFTPQVAGLRLVAGEFQEDAIIGKVYRAHANITTLTLGGNTLSLSELMHLIKEKEGVTLREKLLTNNGIDYQHFNAREIIDKVADLNSDIDNLEVFRDLASNPLEMMKVSPAIRNLVLGLTFAVTILLLMVVTMIVKSCRYKCDSMRLDNNCVTIECLGGLNRRNDEDKEENVRVEMRIQRPTRPASSVPTNLAITTDDWPTEASVPAQSSLDLQHSASGTRKTRRQRRSEQ